MSPFRWTTSWESARLTARPPAAESPPAAPAPGVRVLDLGPGPAVLVRVPTPVGDPVRPYRLVLALHGAGGNARQGLAALLPVHFGAHGPDGQAPTNRFSSLLLRLGPIQCVAFIAVESTERVDLRSAEELAYPCIGPRCARTCAVEK